MNSAMKEVCKKFGGPRQFLQQSFPSTESRITFAKYMLNTLLPLSTTHDYHDQTALPMAAQEDITPLCRWV